MPQTLFQDLFIIPITAADNHNARDIVSTYGQNDGVYVINQNVAIQNSYAPGRYRVGIWMPDASDALRYNPAYAVKLANGNIEWWTDPANKYMINIVGAFDIY